MTPEEYIERYGANLSEADKRYIMVFGAPTLAAPGAARNPYTSGLRIADAPDDDEDDRAGESRT